MTEYTLFYEATRYSLFFLAFKIHIFFDIQLSNFMFSANGISSFQSYKCIIVPILQKE